MCEATLSLGLCDRCLNVELFMTASAFCLRARTNPGDICRGIRLHLARSAYHRDRLPARTCRVCLVAGTGARGHRLGERPIRGTPVDPLIEYFVLTRNVDAAAVEVGSSTAGAQPRPAFVFAGGGPDFADGPRGLGYMPFGWGRV
ncbi:hypothetical protein ISF_05001 [Cordyceps fumosorosea ARSEF 2679]|uniref:Uncharacterized protein n=1 Tax=Cordyceps fumosorosea (strain ARSEF 2679) TaxID=1081104 RepID=A0A167VYM1_CORFA|nr:hypothetical protein ISF_05001 [Cordyceps fumosorosea ARSEF 2679]OAA63125.1 hypothetical protein ISF_05001 [Cordyceps fumosorosea ARSEF 2679]